MSEKPEKSLRENLLSMNQFRKSELEIEVPGRGPTKLEVRCPTVAERNRIAVLLRDDLARGQALACVLCVRLGDGSGSKVFEEADIPALMDMPSGGIVDKLSEAALRLVNAAEEAAKN